MLLREVSLELGARALLPVLRALSGVQPKLREAVQGADRALDTLAEWARDRRAAAQPLVWLHAPSVGEALMAQAIMGELARARPALQLYFTHSSPSAKRVRDRVGAAGASYLPWDTADRMSAALEALRPNAIAFVRTEIWPTLVRLATARSIPCHLLNAVLAPGSSRLKPLGRFALAPAYARLASVGAVNPAAAERFQRLGVAANRIHLTGDARFDQVWARVQALDRSSELLRALQDDRFTLVAGSTWPADEAHVLPAFAQLRTRRPARLIIAPHEPAEAHLAALEARARSLALRPARLGAQHADCDVLIVDRLGVLADLYLLGDWAYVGGGFHAAGLHSVVEPAALGVPVIIGPRHQNAAEAAELVAAGGAVVVSSAGELVAAVEQNAAAGPAARAFVQSRLGAARANADLVLQGLDSSRG